jgi:hypothetical protein
MLEHGNAFICNPGQASRVLELELSLGRIKGEIEGFPGLQRGITDATNVVFSLKKLSPLGHLVTSVLTAKMTCTVGWEMWVVR